MSNRTEQVVMKLAANGRIQSLALPSPTARVMNKIVWGKYDELFTPAFWVSRLWIDGTHETLTRPSYQLGATLEEEVVACMLGGYGMPAEVGLAAFTRFKERALIRHDVSKLELMNALLEPLSVEDRSVRYRYPNQKAGFISSALDRLGREKMPTDDELAFRDWLITFDGIGPKTASWITRNWLRSDQVAILDVHLHRAGLLVGLYDKEDSIAKHYHCMEDRLVRFASALGVKLSVLDDLVWRYMKNWNRIALGSLDYRQQSSAGR